MQWKHGFVDRLWSTMETRTPGRAEGSTTPLRRPASSWGTSDPSAVPSQGACARRAGSYVTGRRSADHFAGKHCEEAEGTKNPEPRSQKRIQGQGRHLLSLRCGARNPSAIEGCLPIP